MMCIAHTVRKPQWFCQDGSALKESKAFCWTHGCSCNIPRADHVAFFIGGFMCRSNSMMNLLVSIIKTMCCVIRLSIMPESLEEQCPFPGGSTWQDRHLSAHFRCLGGGAEGPPALAFRAGECQRLDAMTLRGCKTWTFIPLAVGIVPMVCA